MPLCPNQSLILFDSCAKWVCGISIFLYRLQNRSIGCLAKDFRSTRLVRVKYNVNSWRHSAFIRTIESHTLQIMGSVLCRRILLYSNSDLSIQRIMQTDILNPTTELDCSVPLFTAVFRISNHDPLAVDGYWLFNRLHCKTMILGIIIRDRDFATMLIDFRPRNIALS